MHYGFHQKEQDFNTNGYNRSLIICIRKSRHNTPLNKLNLFVKILPNEISKPILLLQK